MTPGKQIAKGAAWILFFKLISRSIGMISILILARLLSPADFGIVALAMAMITALEMLGNFSFDVALIQNQNATSQHYDTVWTISLMFQTAVSLLLVGAAYPIASIFSEPLLGRALIVLSIVPILDGLQNIKVVDFRKNMLFHKDFTFLLTKRVLSFAVTIPLAFLLRNYWALIIGTIASRLGGTIISYVLIPHLPKLGIKHWKELFNFSKWMFANNLLFFLRMRSSSFIIGKIAGAQSLGVFEVSNEFSNLPMTELVAPINRVVLPGLSKISGNRQQFGDSYIEIIGMIMLLAVPAGIGIAAIAEPLVHVALGDKWLDAVPIISILGIAGAISCTETNTGATCMALGRPDLVAKLYAFYVVILLALTTWFVTKFGVIGAAWALLVAALINIPVYYVIMLRRFEIRVNRFLAVVWRPIIASVFMFFFVRLFLAAQPKMSGSLDTLPVLVQSIAIGLFVYGSTIIGLWYLAGRPGGAEQQIWVQVSVRISRFGRRE